MTTPHKEPTNPCGHKQSEVSTSDEGTSFCMACEKEARKEPVKKVGSGFCIVDSFFHVIEPHVYDSIAETRKAIKGLIKAGGEWSHYKICRISYYGDK